MKNKAIIYRKEEKVTDGYSFIIETENVCYIV